MKILTEGWATIKTWWSMWVMTATGVALVAIPIVAERWPDLAPWFISLFPKHGQQWAPVVGVVLAIAARVVSQAALVEMIKKLFRRKDKGADDGGN